MQNEKEEYIRFEIESEYFGTAKNECTILSYREKIHKEILPVIYSKAFTDEPWKDDWDTFESFDPAGVFLAVDSTYSTPVGFIISFLVENYGYISVLAVIPEYQNMGYGEMLLGKAIEYLSRKGSKKICIDVEETNFNAIKLYEKNGFSRKI